MRADVGARIPLGLSWHITGNWEIFLESSGVAALAILPRFPRFYWRVGAGLGCRYWI